MSKTKNTITFNGKTYDARTGEVIHDVIKVRTSNNVPKSIQDVVNTAPLRQPVSNVLKPISTVQPTRHHIGPDAQAIHSKNQKAATLMRNSVHKPVTKGGTKSLTQEIFVDSKIKQPTRQFNETLNSPRLERAHTISKSNLITKFGSSDVAKVTKRSTTLAVKPSPPHKSESKTHHQIASPAKQSVRDPVNELFSAAIARADSHTQKPYTKPKRPRNVAKSLGISALVMNIGAMVLIVVILAMYFRSNITQQLTLNSVSKQSGISARLPNYKPAGFTMGRPSSPAPGQVVINFQSKSDDSSFVITQEKSTADNDALRNKVVSASQQNYQTYESNGHPIFLYNGANAIWISNGLEYKIEGSKSLSPDQVLRIAASF